MEVDVDGSVYTIGWDQYPYPNELYKLERGASNASVVQTLSTYSNDIAIDENKCLHRSHIWTYYSKIYLVTTGIVVAGGNGQGNNANQLNYPRGVYVDSSGNVYVADSKWQSSKMEPNATAGSTIAGGNGDSNCRNLSQLHEPLKVYVDDEKSLYVLDDMVE